MATTEFSILDKYIKDKTAKRKEKIQSSKKEAITMRKDILDIFLNS